MIQITVDTRRAVVTNKELLTVGSAGIQVEFTLSEDWNALSKLAVFRVGDDGTKVDVVLGENLTCIVPPEVLKDEDEVLFIGVYGTNGQGTVIIPTVWASAGVVKPGTEPETPASATPTPEIWAQILSVANDAEQTATEAMSIVGAGLQDLSTLEGNVETAEAQRVVNEQDRVAAEQQRILAENNREAAENTRASTETVRVNAEASRVTAETGRVTSENARVTAEAARVTAEEGRVAAEENREAHYAEYVTTVQGYANAASASATEAAESASSASTSASSASSSASQASTSASASVINASNAAASAVRASTSATIASNAATTAATKAGEASTSATAAGNAQTAAETAQAAAETAQSAAESAQAAAEEAAESIEESAAQISQNTQDISDVKNAINQLEDAVNDPATGLDTKAPVILETASGAIASFSDGADSMPVRKLVAQIEPVQDLHGYDAPWPGGGGKNKLPPPTQNSQTTSGVTFVKNNDGSITLSGTATANAAIVFVSFDLPAGDYILSNVGSNAAVSGGEATVYVRDITNSATLTSFELGDSVSGFLFTLSANINIRFYAVVQSGVTVSGTLYPMIRNSGDGDNTYAPYSNECPISGHTGLTVARTGKNLFDKSNANILNAYYATGQNQVIHAGSSFRCVWLPCKPNTTYTIINPANGRASIAYTTVEPADNVPVYNAAANTTTTGSDAKYIVMYVWNSTTDTATFDDVLNSLQIELGSTASTYEPYTGTTIPITWQSEAGTVYSGTLDVVSGKLIVDKKIIGCTVNSMRSNYQNIAYAQVRKPTDSEDYNSYSEVDIITSKYPVNPTHPSSWDVASNQGKMFTTPSKDDYWFGFPFGTTLQEAQTALNDCTICYPLATPIEYTISTTELSTLYGQNNVWTDVGEVSVDYPADTKLYIDNKIATAVANALNA